MKEKFIRKFMRLAREIALELNPCYSRQIGVVVIDPVTNSIVSTGYNGPLRDTPHTDEYEYLHDVVWPQLTNEEVEYIRNRDDWGEERPEEFGMQPSAFAAYLAKKFASTYRDCGTCPRRLFGAASGQRNEICSCEHAERNAIYNAERSLRGMYMFCYGAVPCWDCTKAISSAMISRVYVLRSDQPDYSPMARWLLAKKNIDLLEVDPKLID